MDELHRKEDYCEEAQGSERQKAVDNLCDWHAGEKSLYDFNEGNNSEQQLLACLHSQPLLAVSQVYCGRLRSKFF